MVLSFGFVPGIEDLPQPLLLSSGIFWYFLKKARSKSLGSGESRSSSSRNSGVTPRAAAMRAIFSADGRGGLRFSSSHM
jgi:hypothetical protein